MKSVCVLAICLAGLASASDWAKPNAEATKRFVLFADPARNVPAAEVKLPSGCRRGKNPNLFVGSEGAFLSVLLEQNGKRAKSTYASAEYRMKKGQEKLAKVGNWLVWTEYSTLSNGRSTRRHRFYSPTAVVSMLTSWAPADEVAQAEAELMARHVLWSFKAG